MRNFWEKLVKPIYALAPMAGITDSAFRQVCKEYGADVVYSEMASVNALVYNPRKTLEMLVSSKKESPYIIQLFGSNPDHFARAVKLLSNKRELSKFKIQNLKLPDGIDINFGCPVKKVQKQLAGAVLMNDMKLAREIIKTTIENTKLPVSIKTRSRVGDVDILEFLKFMKGLDIKALMIHGRSLSQGHSGPVDLAIIKKARKYFPGIILANGGVKDHESARLMLEKTGADGIGIGQGALGNPSVFQEVKSQKSKVKSKEELLKIALKHAEMAYKLKGEQGVIEMRKHLCWYVQGLPGARHLRERLVRVTTLNEIRKILI
jgi:tRNA-dihydrouridine synthase B